MVLTRTLAVCSTGFCRIICPSRYVLPNSTQAMMRWILYLSYHLFCKMASGVGRLGLTVLLLVEMVNKDEMARAFYPVQGKN